MADQRNVVAPKLPTEIRSLIGTLDRSALQLLLEQHVGGVGPNRHRPFLRLWMPRSGSTGAGTSNPAIRDCFHDESLAFSQALHIASFYLCQEFLAERNGPAQRRACVVVVARAYGAARTTTGTLELEQCPSDAEQPSALRPQQRTVLSASKAQVESFHDEMFASCQK